MESQPRPTEALATQDSCHEVELVSRNEVVYQLRTRTVIRCEYIIVLALNSACCAAAFARL